MTKFKLLPLFIFLFACISGANAIDHVRGNGKLTTKKINIDDYNSIKIDGVIDFNYVQSEDTPELSITIDENLHQYVYIDTEDRELVIKLTGAKVDHYTKFIVSSNSKWLKKVKASGNANIMINSSILGDELAIEANSNCLVQMRRSVQVGSLTLSVTGSANVVGNNVKVEDIKCSITGAGTINVKNGTARNAKYSVSTSGEIMAYGVSAEDAECKVNGSGSIQVSAEKTLKANVMGKGSITYKGTPAVEEKVIGRGTIGQATSAK